MWMWLVVTLTVTLASAIAIWVGAVTALAFRPQIASSPASVTPSPANPPPSAAPEVPHGQGRWVVSGATVNLAGPIATEIDAAGTTIPATPRYTTARWTGR